MNSFIMSLIYWLPMGIIAFPFFALIAKTTIKENKGRFPVPLKIMGLHIILAFLLQIGIAILYSLHIKLCFSYPYLRSRRICTRHAFLPRYPQNNTS